MALAFLEGHFDWFVAAEALEQLPENEIKLAIRQAASDLRGNGSVPNWCPRPAVVASRTLPLMA